MPRHTPEHTALRAPGPVRRPYRRIPPSGGAAPAPAGATAPCLPAVAPAPSALSAPARIGGLSAGTAVRDEPDRAHASRVVNHLLGGARTFGVDRGEAERLRAVAPCLADLIRGARQFRRTVLQAGFAAGIGQVLDLGAGVPTGDEGDTIPARVGGRAVRAVSVDDDPVAAAALQRDLAPPAQVLRHDIAATEAMLDLLAARRLYEPGEASIVLLCLVLHHLHAVAAIYLLGTLRRRLAPGSLVGVACLVDDPVTAAQRAAVTAAYTATPALHLRHSSRVDDLLAQAGWPVWARVGVDAPDGLYTAVLHVPAPDQPGKAS